VHRYPLAASAEVHLKDFQQEDFILLDMGQNFADSVDHACAREGFSPHIRQRFIRMETHAKRRPGVFELHQLCSGRTEDGRNLGKAGEEIPISVRSWRDIA